MRQLRLKITVAGLSLLSIVLPCSLLAEDNTSLIVSGFGTNFPGDLKIGEFGTNNTLQILAAGSVTNTDGYIGYNFGANNNSALVDGSGSLWTNSSLFIGYFGTGNQLTVTNSAQVISSGILYTGYGYGTNQLAVGGGASLSTVTTRIGFGASSVGNRVLITGSGTTWTNTGAGEITIGWTGGDNLLTVADAARVDATKLYIGRTVPASNNTLFVTGNGSKFKVATDVITEPGPVASFIIVSNNAQMTVGGNINFSSTGSGITLADGGKLASTDLNLDLSGGGSPNTILVTGSGSLLSNNNLNVGSALNNNQMTVSNGGQVRVANLFVVNSSTNQITVSGGATLSTVNTRIGFGSGAANNSIVVTGSGTTWTNTGVGEITIGWSGRNNTLTIADGAVVDATKLYVGRTVPASNNTVIVTGNSSKFNVATDVITEPGPVASFIVVSNNAQMTVGGNINFSSTGSGITLADGGKLLSADLNLDLSGGGTPNSILVTGSGSLLSNANLNVGSGLNNNQMTVSTGGQVKVANLFVVNSSTNQITVSGGATLSTANTRLGFGSGAANNNMLVTGSGTTWTNTGGGEITIGWSGKNNTLTIADGAVVDATKLYVGRTVPASNNTVIVTGNSSKFNVATDVITEPGPVASFIVVSNNAQMTVGGSLNFSSAQSAIRINSGGQLISSGSVNVGLGDNNSVLVSGGGLLEAQGLIANGTANSISNVGGIYQFALAAPTITPGANRIAVTDGTVSFRVVTGAPVTPLAGMTYGGNNTFRLNNATNASVASYTFDSAANTGNPSNYHKLALINNSRWQSGSLTIGTNGAVSADAGSAVELTGNFTIHSNDPLSFDLSAATVAFTGGGNHTNLVSGSDLGNNGLVGYADGFTRNFSYGKLTLAAGNDLFVGTGDGTSSNALYVFTLELPGSLTNNVSLLHTLTSDINIYYAAKALSPANAYLNDMVYSLNGGGLLMPAVPEPSAVMLLGIGGLLLLRRRR